ncbi:CdaR family transcriptional regulator [Glutamicibacter arilaitensis]|uniref:CdaR family transcriptional regulator n=1 Tax=Glutamicibacter arilaitensis TaxID=256701 RepID=UPI00384C425C
MEEHEPIRLSSDLAQKVVDTIAPTINRHVNIMNFHGTIIASSDQTRIGSHHESSLEAIRDNRIVDVDRADVEAGTQPGVNAPLMLNEQLCGVVGVTGAPHEVRPLANLIALTVQLLLAQEREHGRSNRRETEARDLLSALLAGITDTELIARRLAAHRLRAPWCLELWIPHEPQPDLRQQHAIDGQRTSWVYLSGGYWRLRTSFASSAAASVAPRDKYLGSSHAANAAQLLSEAEVLRVLSRHPRLVPGRDSRVMWSPEVAVAIARTPERNLDSMAELAASVNAEQARTLLVIASANSMLEAAEFLHIHRNTLVQRIDRVSQLTGIDIRHSAQFLRLQHSIYASIALGRLHIF